ncbi:DNA repair protein XRCC1 [Polymixia lowei]
MPDIRLKHVVSCSSEDSTHKADNLLSSDTYRKWKAARAGEKQTTVILQFEKEEQVHSIDIGNEGSAFIEVLVGNSSAIRDQDYEVLLVTSSFMSPTESRNGTNTNRVRFFGPGQLQKSAAQEKWDRVKIVCSQPYSKNIAYGVAFVKFHSPPDKSDPPATTSPKLTKLGQFRVKDESPSAGPSLQPGSLFFNRENAAKPSPALKVSPQSDKLSYAAAALQSSGGTHSSGHASSSGHAPSSTHSDSPQQPVKKKFEFSKERQAAPAPPVSKKTSPSGSPESRATTSKPKPKPSPASTAGSSTTKASPAQRTPDKKRESQSKPEPKPRPHKAKSQSAEPVPFNRIMEGVVFVLSGFQNPFRGELRDKALALGAKYRPDWTPDATHLICAFANTPKYSQVKSAGGIIVRKEWVLECHKRKLKISCKRYLMDGAESSSESEMEVDENEEERDTRTPPKQERQVTPKKTQIKTEDDDDEYGGSTDIDEPGDGGDSAMDTEDELKRVESERRQKKADTGRKKVKEEDPYGGSTDENTDAEAEEDHPIPELPDFLTGKRFFLYGKFPNNERRLLLRYITAFNGAIEDYMNEKVQFVVTSEGWHDSFEDALMENGNLSFVKPTWIYAINERQKMLPYQPYSVVP